MKCGVCGNVIGSEASSGDFTEIQTLKAIRKRTALLFYIA
jgi:hypothetical protein